MIFFFWLKINKTCGMTQTWKKCLSNDKNARNLKRYFIFINQFSRKMKHKWWWQNNSRIFLYFAFDLLNKCFVLYVILLCIAVARSCGQTNVTIIIFIHELKWNRMHDIKDLCESFTNHYSALIQVMKTMEY